MKLVTVNMDTSTDINSNENNRQLPQPYSPAAIASSSPSSTSNPKNNGIDIKEALSILSDRAKQGGNKETFMKESIDPQLKEMGQTLDLNAPSSSSLMTQERAETAEQILKTTDHMNNNDLNKAAATGAAAAATTTTTTLRQTLLQKSPSELLQTVFQLQQQRVATYQKFNQSLDTILKSGNFSNYTTVTTNVTASFVVISNSMKEIQNLFMNKYKEKNRDIGLFIKKLQELEKEKLHLTAALHLERIRERNEGIDFSVGGSGGGGGDERNKRGNDKIAALLRESIVSLQGKIADCIENINEVMEELRYATDDL